MRPVLSWLYQALVSSICLDLANAGDTVIVEGPAATNETFCAALASFSMKTVYRLTETRGSVLGAAALAYWPDIKPSAPDIIRAAPLRPGDLDNYARAWKETLDMRAHNDVGLAS